MALSSQKPTVGHRAPHFSARAVVDGGIQNVNLLSYASDWLILVFIPMAWSFVCPTEVLAFNARMDEFTSRDARVAFISTDSEHVLRAWNQTSPADGGLGNVSIPLISDRSHKICRDYGVLLEDEGIAQRALFIIDPKGSVRQICINDFNVGRSVDEIVRLLDALEFTDEYGEGCPIDWKKGVAGLKLDYEGEMDSANTSTVNELGVWAQGAEAASGKISLGRINSRGTSSISGSSSGKSHASILDGRRGSVRFDEGSKRNKLVRPELKTANSWSAQGQATVKYRPVSWSPWAKPSPKEDLEVWNADAMMQNQLAV